MSNACPHRERRQEQDPITGEPIGRMRCLACGESVQAKATGPGRCSVCASDVGVRSVALHTGSGNGTIMALRCARCVPPVARNVGGPPGSPPLAR